jgi:TolB protein
MDVVLTIIGILVAVAIGWWQISLQLTQMRLAKQPATPTNPQLQSYRFPIPKINPLPDNIYGKIAFLKGNDYVIVNSDGSGEFVVINTSKSIYFPRIAPGGDKVVFVSAYEGKERVYVINRDGSGLKRLTGPGGGKYDGYASWSPDGTKLIFRREYSISNDIYFMDSTGNDQKNLTNIWTLGKLSLNMFSEFPWSPDSQRIVFTSNREGSFKIYIMDRNGENLRQLMRNSNTEEYGAVWAPNRNTIAYVSTGGAKDETDIFTLNVDSPRTKPINITKSPHHDTSPVWSPDGTQILFVSDRDSNKELYIMNSDGSNVRRVTHAAEPKDNPSWLR